MPLKPLICAAVFALALGACGRAADEAAEAAAERAIAAEAGGDADVDIESQDGQQSITVGTADGQLRHVSGDNVALPADFPTDIALPADYAVLSVMTMGPSLSVVLRSPGDPTDVYAKLRADQASQGWKELLSMESSEGSVLGFEKGKRGLLLNVAKDADGQSTVSMSLDER